MRYYISVDGGGTKINAVLFDDNLRLLGYGRGEGVNTLFNTYEQVERAVKTCIEETMSSYKGVTIEKAYISTLGPKKLFAQTLEAVSTVKEVMMISEETMILLSGIQQKNGLVAMAGTGSRTSWVVNEETLCLIGGWGGLLGDQGSGFDIGRNGLAAAAKAYEGWGPETVLCAMIRDEWKLDDYREVISHIYTAPSYYFLIASVARIVSNAACSGDKVAISIFREAGRDMAFQAISLAKRLSISNGIPIVISGGAWKGCKVMFDNFCSTLKREYPQASIHVPLFEPVMGGIIRNIYETGKMLDTKMLAELQERFSQFIYGKQWESVDKPLPSLS